MDIIRALHIASFNGNIGDNANHNGFRHRIKESINKEIEFDNLEIREFYKSWNFRDFNSDDFINLCNSYDLIIIGGGNFFELKWDYSYTGTTINMSNSTLERIVTPILFNALGCDIAKGANKDTISKFKSFLEKIINNPKIFISLRNDGSMDTLKKLYGDKFCNKILQTPDAAFFMKTELFDFPEIRKEYKSIGINIVADMKNIRFKGESNTITYNEFIEKLSVEINVLLKNYSEYQIIFFPHIYSDLMAINDLLEKIDDVYRRTRIIVAPFLTGEGSEKYIFGLYSKCEIIMGMRFHSNVCSISQNIPTIALSSYKKIDDLYSELELSDRVVNVNKKQFDLKLHQMIESTLQSIPEIKLKYHRTNEKIFQESDIYFNALNKWIHSIVL